MRQGRVGRIVSTLRRILVTDFALVGFFDVAVRLLLLPLTGTMFGKLLILPFETTLNSTVESPDGKYKALVFSEEGSGLDPHCLRIVSVVAKDKPARRSWGAADRVYVDDCTGFETLSWAPLTPTTPAGGGALVPRLLVYARSSTAWLVSRKAVGGAVEVEVVR